ncbi:MAG: oligopeptide transporter, OPT family [Chlamydiae bacterium]|nr:oligopeptide transporter, OPT family [Chlamydiota bacterium]
MTTKFTPYIKSGVKTPEFTVRAVILGVILGLVFGVGNAYLGLKVGTTVSASIPAAVMSMAILRTFFHRASILENNLVQTIASVGEGLAGGVIFTVPALFILGQPPSIFRIFLLSLLGGILGVLFMIPMRRYIIVHEHGNLPFPEGTACAEILKSSLKFLEKTEFSLDGTPSLLGVGYIIGPRTASLLLGGGGMAWWVIIPLIRFFGEGNPTIIQPATIPISQMDADQIWSSYVRYIGAGAVAVGGFLSLFQIGPMIGKTIKAGIKELFEGARPDHKIERTEKDISLRWLILGSVAIILTLWLFPGLPMNLLTILLLVVLGFFFVAVTSLTVGIIGSTSNPVSGMTITTLLITCFIFLLLGWTEKIYLISAITMSVVANVAIALAGTTSQDLKTGFLLGATPRSQQIAELIGLVVPAAAIGGTLYLLSNVYGFGSAQLPAPQGTMMALVAKGVIQGNIPTTLMIIGALLGLFMQLFRLPILPFAIGLYLPLSLSTPIMFGGIVSYLVEKKSSNPDMKKRGILAASGLVAGDACTGVFIALLSILGIVPASKAGFLPGYIGIAIFGALGLALGWFSLKPASFFKKKG